MASFSSSHPPPPHLARLCYVNADGCGRSAVIFHPSVTRDKRRATSCRNRPHCSPLSQLTSARIVAPPFSRSPHLHPQASTSSSLLKVYASSLGPRGCEIKMLGGILSFLSRLSFFLSFFSRRCVCVPGTPCVSARTIKKILPYTISAAQCYLFI